MSRTVIDSERRLPYAPGDLRDLVSDVRSYPSFIPWLQALEILSERNEGGVHEFTARAAVGWRALRERFTTKVRVEGDRVDVALVDGPFKHLENSWRFLDDGEGAARVKFHIVFEFKNVVLQQVANLNRDIVADRIMAAFEKEAARRFS
jgi:coenzyme Q-binding protein COQ10